MTYDTLLKDARGRMDKALGHVGDLLRTIRTSRASAALVENIRVDYYGTPTPVSQLAGISIPEARQIVIKPFDANALGDVVKAIQKSDLGITPENDGKLVRLTIPPGIQSGEVLRLRGWGLPELNGRGKGDQLVHLVVWTPERLWP